MATDPFDWPAHAANMRDLDSALRCTICHEFYNTPKLLPCGHSYCSECIRKQGDVQMRTGPRLCPDCRAPWEPAHLDTRPVQSLSLAVKAYQQSRSYLLSAVQQLNAEAPRSSEPAADSVAKGLNRGSKRTRRQVARDSNPEQAQKQCVHVEDRAGPASNTPSKSSCSAGQEHNAPVAAVPQKAPEVPPAGCGICPICSRVVSLSYLQSHVDSCLISTEATTSRVALARTGAPAAVLDLTDSTGEAFEAHTPPMASLVPPKLCFQLLKEKDARKKLQDCGLSTQGDRVELERRYQAFRQYVQTAHDRGDRASLKRFAKRFSMEEHKRAEAISSAPKRVPDADADFETLIAVAKQRMAEHKARMEQQAALPGGDVDDNVLRPGDLNGATIDKHVKATAITTETKLDPSSGMLSDVKLGM
eukprot:jgi/Ulvmu1/5614/UM023_0152.1